MNFAFRSKGTLHTVSEQASVTGSRQARQRLSQLAVLCAIGRRPRLLLTELVLLCHNVAGGFRTTYRRVFVTTAEDRHCCAHWWLLSLRRFVE